MLAVGLAEGFARVFSPVTMPPDLSRAAAEGEPVPGEPNMLGDALAGWRPRPGPQRSFGIPGGTSVSASGLRGPEPAERATGERRVLLLGDSTVFGVMVDDAQTFAALLEGRLQALDPSVRVLNGGCPGYSSWQALQVLRERLLPLEPDLVVVGTLWSDTQGADLPDSVRFGGPARRWLYRSRAFLLLASWVDTLRYGAFARPPPPEPVTHGLAPPAAPTMRVPLGEYRRNLGAMAHLARDVGAGVAFLVLPCVRDPAGRGVGDHRDAWRRAMREVAAAEGAPLADTPAAFAGADPNAMFLDEVHPSPAGHARIAEILAASLEPWVRGR
jgi:lysophospholipase L1-like esterase